ncbi:MAG TPA: NAD(P)H-hydrate dehydratase [Thermoguttaceae bacterium]|nr:NAD(P)H-hydrate dehydratase [Thermoguttaceae bacterium]
MSTDAPLPFPTNQATLPRLPRREADAHKGRFGLALIIGGSRGMSGAAALAGMAALRGGAGLVRLAVPDACLDVVAAHEPSYMTIPLPSTADGQIADGAREVIDRWLPSATCVAVGPGLGRGGQLDALVAGLYRDVPQPMVVDADALNALATQPDVLPDHAGPRILTPHPGEFARLIGAEKGDRHLLCKAPSGPLPANGTYPLFQQAVELAERCRVVMVLKGHHTCITDGRKTYLNTTGNPGMATGGSGDVLTGLVTALVCQGLAPRDAARLGVHLHGLAGDLAAEALGEVSMIAGDLIRFLPEAMKA